MDSSNDNPMKQFSSFWLGLILFVLFGVLALLLGLVFNKPVRNSYDMVNSERRLEIRAEVDAAQAGSKEAAAGSFASVGDALLAVSPEAVRDDQFIVPGSETALEKAAAGDTAVKTPEGFPQVAADAPVDAAVMAQGKTLFATCVGCHGPDANGITNLGPPLAGSEWVTGPVENLIAIQLRGLMGPIEVKGQTYNPPAPMAPLAYQTDEQIAAVLTYIRNDFGNKASPVTPEQVKAFRGEVGKPFLKASDLRPPK